MKKQIIELITKLIVMSGFKLAGFQAWLASLLVKKVVKEVVEQGELVVDDLQNKKAEKVLSDPKATEKEKQDAFKEILEGK